MKFEEAKTLIKKHYGTSQFASDIEIIKIDKLINFSNYYFVILRKDKDGSAKLSDLKKTCEFFDYEENYYKDICAKHNVTFNNWAIETKFESMQDLDNMIAVLDEIVKA